MAHGLKYTGNGLDRASAERRDPAWVAARLAAADTRIVPVWRSRNLIAGLDDDPAAPRATFVDGSDAAGRLIEAADELVLLGLDGGTAYFATDLSEFEEPEAAVLAADTGGAFVDLRQAGSLMSRAEAALSAYARGMMHWHRRHRFCGVCGRPTQSRHGGHLRVCDAPDGGHETFPRTDPAVIMLIHHQPTGSGPPLCLLGRHNRWAPGNYSTLAGFVEPGESLEETVAREVWEEAGVRVDEVRYRASQPWPFPSSLMLGFWGRAETTDIAVDGEELEDAQWFTAGEVRGFGEWGQSSEGSKCLPRRDSISRWLIDTWLDEVGA